MGAPPALVVIDSGLLCSVQDLGRHGYAAAGVSPSGAADWFSARAANRLVGNADAAALIETTLSGATFEARSAIRAAVTGADAALTVGGRARSLWRSHDLRPGDRIAIGPARRGLRSYVAIEGGVDVASVMASAATDVGSGFGGRLLKAGDAVVVIAGSGAGSGSDKSAFAYPKRVLPELSSPVVLRTVRGPHAAVEKLAGASLIGATYRASNRSSRQGLRLEGEPISLQAGTDIVSAGICAGCVQLGSDGLPTILLSEHQTTGGYAIVLCVITADVPLAAQIRPGGSVRFSLVGYQEAAAALRDVAAALGSLGPAAANDGYLSDARLSSGFYEGV